MPARAAANTPAISSLVTPFVVIGTVVVFAFGASSVASHADAINDIVSATLEMILGDMLVDVWKGISVVQVQFEAA